MTILKPSLLQKVSHKNYERLTDHLWQCFMRWPLQDTQFHTIKEIMKCLQYQK